jgi:hypothetical protein
MWCVRAEASGCGVVFELEWVWYVTRDEKICLEKTYYKEYRREMLERAFAGTIERRWR